MRSDHQLRWNPWHEIRPDWNASVAGFEHNSVKPWSLTSVVSTCHVGFRMASRVKVSAVHQAIRTRSSHFADRQLIRCMGRVWNQNLSPFALLQERRSGCLQACRFHSRSKSNIIKPCKILAVNTNVCTDLREIWMQFLNFSMRSWHANIYFSELRQKHTKSRNTLPQTVSTCRRATTHHLLGIKKSTPKLKNNWTIGMQHNHIAALPVTQQRKKGN